MFKLQLGNKSKPSNLSLSSSVVFVQLLQLLPRNVLPFTLERTNVHVVNAIVRIPLEQHYIHELK